MTKNISQILDKVCRKSIASTLPVIPSCEKNESIFHKLRKSLSLVLPYFDLRA